MSIFKTGDRVAVVHSDNEEDTYYIWTVIKAPGLGMNHFKILARCENDGKTKDFNYYQLKHCPPHLHDLDDLKEFCSKQQELIEELQLAVEQLMKQVDVLAGLAGR